MIVAFLAQKTFRLHLCTGRLQLQYWRNRTSSGKVLSDLGHSATRQMPRFRVYTLFFATLNLSDILYKTKYHPGFKVNVYSSAGSLQASTYAHQLVKLKLKKEQMFLIDFGLFKTQSIPSARRH
jgi:hypothetical protein